MTLNCCIHLPGARNVYNIKLVSRSVFFLLAATNVGLSFWSTSVALRVMAHVLSLPFSIIVGQPLAMISSSFIYALKKDDFSEFKSERIDQLYSSNSMHTHDVFAVQELYGSRFWGSKYYQSYMKGRCEEAGLKYSAFGGPPRWWMLFDSGLAIFSRHPITRSASFVFRKQSIWDYLFVSRASLYTQLDLGGKSMHVFTLHTAPSLDDMKKRTALASLLEEKIPTVRRQGDELGDFMTRMLADNYNKETDKIVVMGDFNVKAGTLDYFHFANLFSTKFDMVDVTRKGSKGSDDDKWEPTFGLVDVDGAPLERLLTSPGLRGKPQTLDFIFTNAEKSGESRVLSLANDDTKETR
eukprot:CAMPEP_0118642470 /NCGR_PEP_ID=MMETSP0785-20121206/5850_1 /TAXON_ID=91992 /ORGANISM="Bolidomonas pacifica, Strain CCMP 1866" /LENGTH=352 /DNA_ID=CAMNT_0006534019 /DNA_START=374 /DNA_END=1428 /DNA_ORIENTATION=+